MVANYALMPIFGYPAIMYGGILTLILLLTTASIGIGIFKGWLKWNFIVHPIIASITIVVAIIHGILGLSIFLGF